MEEFLDIQTPILTSNDCEGGGETFLVSRPPTQSSSITPSSSTRHSPNPMYLTVSSQLHLEALSSSFPRVYTLSPTFRAEMSDTNRHLMEFYMLELEMGFISDLQTILDVCERLIKAVGRDVLVFCKDDIGIYDALAEKDGEEKLLLRKSTKASILSDQPWDRITYLEACKILQSSSSLLSIPPPDSSKHDSLKSEHEKFLSSNIFSNRPVFVTHYPKTIKPFYMKTLSSDSDYVENFDLLVPQWELAGGSIREENLSALEKRVKEDGVENLEWYLELRKYGSVPHGGFGIGWERLVGWITGVDNLRDCMAFPRSSGEASIMF